MFADGRPLAIDLCAGAGGLSLGLHRAGFDVLGVELDAAACATHRANVGPCEETSIVDWHPPCPVLFVAAGVPCQPFSLAGKREGTAVANGQLYQEPFRVAAEAGARAVMLENVRGMTSWRDADGWSIVARIEATAIVYGFPFCTWRVLSCARYGTPQKRLRLLFVAFRDEAAALAFRWPEETHAAPGELPFGAAPQVTVRVALGLGLGLYASGLKPQADPSSPQGMRLLDVDQPAPTVARVGESLSPLDEPACTVTAMGHDTAPDKMRPSRRPIAELAQQLQVAGLLDAVCLTVTGRDSVPRVGRPHRGESNRGSSAPRLTLGQRAALQGFPAGFVWQGKTAGSRDKQCGNAVPPQLGEAMGGAVLLALEVGDQAVGLGGGLPSRPPVLPVASAPRPSAGSPSKSEQLHLL